MNATTPYDAIREGLNDELDKVESTHAEQKAGLEALICDLRVRLRLVESFDESGVTS